MTATIFSNFTIVDTVDNTSNLTRAIEYMEQFVITDAKLVFIICFTVGLVCFLIVWIIEKMEEK